jgi:hypothetical protein
MIEAISGNFTPFPHFLRHLHYFRYFSVSSTLILPKTLPFRRVFYRLPNQSKGYAFWLGSLFLNQKKAL